MDQAATLTAIGAGTAFALLLSLTVLIAVVGWVVRKVEGRSSAELAEAASQDMPSDAAGAKALAAVVAVTAAMQEESRTQG